MSETTEDRQGIGDPVSRRRFMVLAGGSSAAAAFLAACGDDDDDATDAQHSTSETHRHAEGGDDALAQFGKGDIGIVNYALTLEYLEAAFYLDVEKSGLFKGDDLALIKAIRPERGRARRGADRRGQAVRRHARAEAEDEVPARRRTVGAGSWRPRSRTSERPPTSGRRRAIQDKNDPRLGARDPHGRGAPRGGPQHRSPASRRRRTARSPSRPTRRRCWQRSNRSSSAERVATRKERNR